MSETMSEGNLCKECGRPSRLTYCSKLCATRSWRKTPGCMKNKCLECGKPCEREHCSYKCRSSVKTYKENCLKCGKEFIYHKIGYKLRGGMKYCSLKCCASIYTLTEDFFKLNTDIPLLYQTLGHFFSIGKILDYSDGKIELRSNQILIEKLKIILKTTYPIKVLKKSKDKGLHNLVIRSKIMLDYLHNIGFSHNLAKHEFPVILDEYKKYFIQGYINTPKTFVYEKEDHNLVIIIGKSFNLMKGIAEYTGGELITKKLEFCCVFKDYERFYTKRSVVQ